MTITISSKGWVVIPAECRGSSYLGWQGRLSTALICMINFGEVLYMTERRRGLVAAYSVQVLIESLPIKLLEVPQNLVLDVVHIKAQHGLSYADAFVVAIAKQGNAIILTADPEFHTVGEMVKIEWLK